MKYNTTKHTKLL